MSNADPTLSIDGGAPALSLAPGATGGLPTRAFSTLAGKQPVAPETPVSLRLPALEDSIDLPCALVWGLPLASITFGEAVEAVDRLIARGRPSFFITANLHYAMLCDRDPQLADLSGRAAFLLADGMPMVWYSRLLGTPLPERVTGADLLLALCQRAAQRGHCVFLLGAAPEVARTAAANLTARYPGLKIVGVQSPPCRPLSEEEHRALVTQIRQSHADLLFLAFGQPKGERWLDEHCQSLGVPACVQIGAALDFAAGRLRRAPRWMQRMGLEWAYRVLGEPGRLAPRYFRNALFLVRAILGDFGVTLARWIRRLVGQR